jgi:pimeloyl-ACP methyl ester carboxylesterase
MPGSKYIVIGLLGVLGIAAVSVYMSFQRDLNAARDRLAKIPRQVYSSQYGAIEYHLTGSGPTVLVSHGVTGGIDQGMLITEKFFKEGYQFLYVSRFGYLGSSFPEGASAKLQAAAYSDLLDHLGIDQVFVLGNSAGGPSTLWFAIDYPMRVKGLILQSSAAPGPVVTPPPRQLFEHDILYWAAVKVAPDMLIGLLLPKEIRATLSDQERQSLLQDVFLAALPVSERARGIVFDHWVSTPSVNDIPLEQIHVPVLILQSVDDPREQAGGAELARRIAGSQYVQLTGGHFLLRQEKPVQSAIADFVANYT